MSLRSVPAAVGTPPRVDPTSAGRPGGRQPPGLPPARPGRTPTPATSCSAWSWRRPLATRSFV